MASHTINGQRWPDGTLVGVYPAAAQKGTEAPSGAAVTSQTVSGGSVTFTGLVERVHYVAYAASTMIRFLVPTHSPTDSLRSRVDEIGDVSTGVVADVTVPDAVIVNVEDRKPYKVPRADKSVHDLRDFYVGSSQPADMLGYIQDGLAKSAVDGGALLIPDSQEPWVITGPITPPLGSRMTGPSVPARFNARASDGAVMHGPEGYRLPVLPNHIGEAWIRLANGANCPMVRSDYDNSEGLRGPLYSASNAAYWAWFQAYGIVFDHNGRNQVGSTIRCIDIRDAWAMYFSHCRLVSVRGLGFVLDNSNSCNADQAMAVGAFDNQANGFGDIASGSPNVSNATGTWAVGDLVGAGAGGVQGRVVTNVAGATLTLSGNATANAIATAMTKQEPMAEAMLKAVNTSTDSQWTNIDMHGARNTVHVDGAWGLTITGHAGYAVYGHTLLVEDSAASPSGTKLNKIDLRLDQASKHNCRISSGVVSNEVDLRAIRPGMLGATADSDGGWCNVFCDGKKNVIRGVGEKGSLIGGGTGNAVGAFGPNAEDNDASGFRGGGEYGADAVIWAYRPASLAAPGTAYSNIAPGPPPFFIPARDFEAAESTAPTMVVFNALHKVLAFADGATEAAVAYCTIPYGVRKVAIRPQLVNLNTANSGNVRIQVGLMDVYHQGGNTLAGDEQPIPLTAAVAANLLHIAPLFGLYNVVPGDVLTIRFKRFGADAADTLTSSLGLIGCHVRPATVA